ncbi:MAG: hypothetical protein PHF67_04655 [Candidatus Nanoarchaeia archaeon]|nr:hypothetical protein [Candidatus Nanoarchaeia archaeon]
MNKKPRQSSSLRNGEPATLKSYIPPLPILYTLIITALTMTESRYVKFDYAEALSAKREILSSEINLLNISKHIENYKELRKRELLNKLKILSLMTELKNKLNSIQLSFPDETGHKKIRIKKTEQITEKKETPKLRNIEYELDDIKTKLAKLM